MAAMHTIPIARFGAKMSVLAFSTAMLTAATLPPADGPGDGTDREVAPAPPHSEIALYPVLGVPVPDHQLDAMRGRFISPDAISYFGISMLTSWQDENGITTAARLAFNVDFLSPAGSGSPVPRLLIGWERTGDSAMDVAGVPDGYVAVTLGPDQALGGAEAAGALDTVGGAVQANVIAGADNVTRNSMQIAVVPRDALPTAGPQGLEAASGNTSVGFADGDQLQFRMEGNELGLVMTGGNGLDSTMQTVGGDLGQMLQQTMLQSDRNSVFNSSAIVFGVETARNLDRTQGSEVLLSMKGFGF